MKTGSWILTLTRKLPGVEPGRGNEKFWDLVFSVKLPMSWGPATVNLHRKVK